MGRNPVVVSFSNTRVNRRLTNVELGDSVKHPVYSSYVLPKSGWRTGHSLMTVSSSLSLGCRTAPPAPPLGTWPWVNAKCWVLVTWRSACFPLEHSSYVDARAGHMPLLGQWGPLPLLKRTSFVTSMKYLIPTWKTYDSIVISMKYLIPTGKRWLKEANQKDEQGHGSTFTFCKYSFFCNI